MIHKEEIANEYKRVRALRDDGHFVDAVGILRNLVMRSLSDRESEVLGVVREKEPVAMVEVATKIDVTEQRASNLLKDLESYGLVFRKGNFWWAYG